MRTVLANTKQKKEKIAAHFQPNFTKNQLNFCKISVTFQISILILIQIALCRSNFNRIAPCNSVLHQILIFDLTRSDLDKINNKTSLTVHVVATYRSLLCNSTKNQCLSCRTNRHHLTVANRK